MYTQYNFKDDLEMMQQAAESRDVAALSSAIARGKLLMSAGGDMGSVVTGSNRSRLQQMLVHCEASLASGGSDQAGQPPKFLPPEPALDPRGSGQVADPSQPPSQNPDPPQDSVSDGHVDPGSR